VSVCLSDADCVLNRLSGTETNELHGQHHPSVAIKFGAEPLVSRGQGRMELRFRIVGALVGFKYRIVLKEVDILVHPGQVIQQQEISFSPTDDPASNEITVEIVDGTQSVSIRFVIWVWDAHDFLSEDEALVARKDATFPRPKNEVLILKSQLHRGLI
jgi:hypothetical protein